MDARFLSRDGHRTAGIPPYPARYHGAYASPLPPLFYAARQLSPAYGSTYRSAFSLPETYPSELLAPALPRPLRGCYASPVKRRSSPISRSLGPRKKSFKQKIKKKETGDNALAEETRRLHNIYRTSVNSEEKAPDKQKSVVAGVKRKEPEGTKQDQTDQKDNDVVAKKRKRRKHRKPVNDQKHPSIQLQRDASKSFGQFLIQHVHQKGEIKKSQEQSLNVDEANTASKEESLTPKEEEQQKEDKGLEPALKEETVTLEKERNREDKAFEFMSKYLEENRDLHNLYVKKWRRGVFVCLVCSCDGTLAKGFPNVGRLLVHTSGVQRISDRQPEHRALRRVLCSVLGWDQNKIPKMPGRHKRKKAEKKRAHKRKGIEASLEVQRCVCKSITEFLGIEFVEEKSGKQRSHESLTKMDEETKADAQYEDAPKEERLTPEEEKEREDKVLEFFSNCLKENEELSKFYLEHWKRGIFECSVCFSIYQRPTRKYFKLASLVAHAYEAQKTQPEHRAYGHALCTLLDWEYSKTSTPQIIMKRLIEVEAESNGAKRSKEEDKYEIMADSEIDAKEVTSE